MRFWWMIGATALVACGGDNDSASDGTGDSGPPTADTGTFPTTSTTQNNSARLQGTVRGPSGPLAEADIRFCRGTQCRYYTTEADGAYTFDDATVAWHSLEIVPPESSGLATAFAPIELLDQQDRTIDLTLVPLETSTPLGAPAEIALGSGLLVTLGAADLEPPLFVDPATHAGGTQVPAELWPPIDQPGTVIALWYTEPFDHQAVPAGGLPIRVENQWGLTEGSAYDVWVGSYKDSAWLPAGSLVADPNGILVGDAALPLLGTVALVAR